MTKLKTSQDEIKENLKFLQEIIQSEHKQMKKEMVGNTAEVEKEAKKADERFQTMGERQIFLET